MANAVLSEEQIQILLRNGIDPKPYGVEHVADGYMVFLNRDTHHEVMIIRGQCKWLPQATEIKKSDAPTVQS